MRKVGFAPKKKEKVNVAEPKPKVTEAKPAEEKPKTAGAKPDEAPSSSEKKEEK